MTSSRPALAPLRQPWFRWLWSAVLVSQLGGWMQLVGVQWALVDRPHSASALALVQTAAMLPIMLLAVPARMLAEVTNRRWLMFATQAYLFVVAGALAVLTALGHATTALLLIFTFALGVGGAVLQSTWQAVVPELVPRDQLAAANRLELLSVNLGRSIGPAVAGLVIALSGIWNVFAVNAMSVLFLAAMLLLWRRTPQPGPRVDPVQATPGLRVGAAEARRDPVVRRLLLRAVLFLAPGAALWALLPLAAHEQVGVDVAGYGMLFAALGAGTVVAVVAADWIRGRVPSNLLLAGAGVVLAAALVVLVLVPFVWLALPVCLLGGLAWTTAILTLDAELRLLVSGGARVPGPAVYLVIFTGTLAAASLIWGQVAEVIGVTGTFVVAAAVLLAGVVIGVVLPVSRRAVSAA